MGKSRISAALSVCLLPISLVLGNVPTDIMERSLAAMGVQSTTEVRNVRISGSQFRTRSMITTISLDSMDQTVVLYGSLTNTFSYEGNSMKQRIDKVAGLGTLWVFARPELEPMDYSMVIQTGNTGYAAVTKGSYTVFDPTAAPQGLLDGYVAAHLISESHKWDPLLLRTIRSNNNYTLRYETVENGLQLPAVFDHSLNMSVIFAPDTNLPFAIRTYEDHHFFGPSTNDLRVYNYRSVNGIMIPSRFKVMYNNERLVTDFLASDITVNGAIEAGFFDAPTALQAWNIPIVDPSWTAEISEKEANFLWFGWSSFNVTDLDVRQPYPDLPGVYSARLPGVGSYRQILLETETHVVVMDAPTDSVAVLLEWVRINIGKPVKQIWPTHHHHDHAMGVRDFVAAGAEVVVPTMAKSYYSKIPGVKFATYDRGAPYIVETNDYRAAFIHVEGSMHAVDHSIAVIMPRCPTVDSSVVVFDADHVVQAQLMGTHNDHVEIAQFVAALVKHRVSKSAFLSPVHGELSNLTAVFDSMGYLFPEYTPLDFEYRSKTCTT